MNPHDIRCALAVLAGLVLLGGFAPRHAAGEEDVAIGRLFLSPAERQLLDQRRGRTVSDTELPADLLPARALPQRRLALNGVVRRDGHEPLVWINGAPATVPGQGVRVRSGGTRPGDRVTLEVGRSGALVRLKPGQAFDPVTGQVHDCIACGAAPPPPAAPGPPPPEPVAGVVTAADAAAAGDAAAAPQ